MSNEISRTDSFVPGADAGLLERGFRWEGGVGSRGFVVFNTFFLTYPLKMKSLVSLKPKYFIFSGYLKQWWWWWCVCGGGGAGVVNDPEPPPLDPPLYSLARGVHI